MLSGVFRSGVTFRKQPNYNKIKGTFTRTMTSRPKPTKNKFTTMFLVCGAAAGGAGLAFTLGSNLQNVPNIEPSMCQPTQDNEGHKVNESSPKIDKAIDDGKYEARLQDAITEARDLLRRAKDEYGAPGIVAAISVDGQCLWSEGLGYSDVENRVPCTSSTVHRVASISKSFTMVAVAKLMESGRLNLDRPVQEYVPSFPEKKWNGEKVTITTKQLLSHLSGIRHYSKAFMKSKKDNSKDDESKKNAETKEKSPPGNAKQHDTSDVSINTDYTQLSDAQRKGDERFKEFYMESNCSDTKRALDIFKDDPLVHPPGKTFLYSTYGWTLISAVVEAAGGKPFLQQMADIFKDMDMIDTVPDENTPLIYNRARGYSHNKRGRLVNTPHVNLSTKWAGGGFLSTVGDLIKFGNAMLYSYQYTNKHKENNLPAGYLKPETMATIWKPVSGTKGSWDPDAKYAMGWAVVDLDQTHGQCRKARHLVSHTGGAVGFSSVLLIVPSKEDISLCKKLNIKNAKMKDYENDLVVSDPPKGVVVAIITNLGATSLYKAAVKMAEIFKDF